MNIVAVLMFTLVDGHGGPSLSLTVALVAVSVVLLGLSFLAIKDMHRTGRSGVVAVALAIALALLTGSTAVLSNTSRPHRRERAYSILCSGNLRQIGTATAQYKSDHGAWPGSLEDVAQIVEAGRLSCPFDESGRRYYYIPPRTDHPGPDVVVAFELPSHLDEMNLLLSAGFVESLKGEAALRALAELAAGLNPPPSLGLGASAKTLPARY